VVSHHWGWSDGACDPNRLGLPRENCLDFEAVMALAADFGTEPSHKSANLVQLASGIGTGHAGATGNMRWAVRRRWCTWVGSVERQDDQREEMTKSSVIATSIAHRTCTSCPLYSMTVIQYVINAGTMVFYPTTASRTGVSEDFQSSILGVWHHREIPWKGVNPTHAESCAHLWANMHLYKSHAHVCALYT